MRFVQDGAFVAGDGVLLRSSGVRCSVLIDFKSPCRRRCSLLGFEIVVNCQHYPSSSRNKDQAPLLGELI